MNVYLGAYERSLFENEKKRQVWTEYLKEIKSLDLSVFRDKLRVPALIPIGSRLSLRGELIHTNEVTVALGAGYFVKCTVSQAENIMEHRVKVAEENIKSLEKEKEYMESHLSFSNENVLKETGKEIVETYDENSEKEWRLKHKEKLRKYKMEEKAARERTTISDDDLWEKLEELELKEELEKELQTEPNDSKLKRLKEAMDIELVNEKFKKSTGDGEIPISKVDMHKEETPVTNGLHNEINDVLFSVKEKNINNEKVVTDSNENFGDNIPDISIHKRISQIKKELSEIKSKKITRCTTEEDVFKRLEQLEQQEILEEELDRLEDEIETSDEESKQTASKKSISFADDNESECIEICFTHSDFSPEYKTYNKTEGIQKPSDIYSAFPENFQNTPVTSILKKTKYENENIQRYKIQDEEIPVQKNVKMKTVNSVIGDICENKENKIVNSERPISKFKAMRMQKKQA